MTEHAAAIKCKLTRQEEEELNDATGVPNDPDNPLDKSDSFHLDADNVARRTQIIYSRNIFESNDNNKTVSVLSKSTNASEVSYVMGEISDNSPRSSGFIHVNNLPHESGEDVDLHTDDGEILTSQSVISGTSTGILHLPKFSSRKEKNESFRKIKDQFKSVKEVTQAMKDESVTECNLIVGIDYTLSNKIQGQKTFGGRSLHDMTERVINPYKEVMCIFGETLDDLKSEDAEIVVFGFGKELFLLTSKTKCSDFSDVLDTYEEVTPTVKLGGPTDFSPLIQEAIKIVERTKKYHILLIIADGQVTKEEETIEAIIEASNYALSIVVIGVGD